MAEYIGAQAQAADPEMSNIDARKADQVRQYIQDLDEEYREAMERGDEEAAKEIIEELKAFFADVQDFEMSQGGGAGMGEQLAALGGPPQAAPPRGYKHGGLASAKAMADAVESRGRYGDSMLVHMNPAEVQGLASLGGMTINPETGKPEFFLQLLAPLLGSLLGPSVFGALGMSALPGWALSGLGSFVATTAATGSLEKGLLTGLLGGGLGAFMGGLGGAAEVPLSEIAAAGGGSQAGVWSPEMLSSFSNAGISPGVAGMPGSNAVGLAAGLTPTKPYWAPDMPPVQGLNQSVLAGTDPSLAIPPTTPPASPGRFAPMKEGLGHIADLGQYIPQGIKDIPGKIFSGPYGLEGMQQGWKSGTAPMLKAFTNEPMKAGLGTLTAGSLMDEVMKKIQDPPKGPQYKELSDEEVAEIAKIDDMYMDPVNPEDWTLWSMLRRARRGQVDPTLVHYTYPNTG